MNCQIAMVLSKNCGEFVPQKSLLFQCFLKSQIVGKLAQGQEIFNLILRHFYTALNLRFFLQGESILDIPILLHDMGVFNIF